ncbi:DUF5618 family protein [Dyadobacter aurulentus]|uniref:DUF5618 family protein n=1 Tax=Dyadobacter sp. UC 10 TaxID=2605428 RepID=UPI0011F121FA|nr:DUF5618 family protein [Dyadobacter sp. UC 10]KAA0990539.1 hypothetical protein FXO21_10395 [Dyadobacter sp. UC 10]
MESITEARRHIANAKNFLSVNAKKQDGIYLDRKYVKIAGHTAYTGVLLALDELLPGTKKKTRKGVEWYQKELSVLDKKVMSNFATAYELLHLSMGYDGSKSVRIANIGLEEAEKIIDWVETRLEKRSN